MIDIFGQFHPSSIRGKENDITLKLCIVRVKEFNFFLSVTCLHDLLPSVCWFSAHGLEPESLFYDSTL